MRIKSDSKIICMIVLVVLIPFLCKPLSVHGQAKVKVHKPFVTVSVPNEQGVVQVTGAAGAVQSDGPVTVQIINLRSEEKIPVILNEDGSFSGVIAAVADDKIRILARNQKGKRSYGTFTVSPRTLIGSEGQLPVESAVKKPSEATSEKSDTKSSLLLSPAVEQKPAPVPKNESIELAVIITVVNTSTGEIVAAKRIAGATRAKQSQPRLLAAVIQNIIGKCSAVVNAELKRRAATGEALRPVKNNKNSISKPIGETVPAKTESDDPNAVR